MPDCTQQIFSLHKKLRVFLAVARHKSFTLAARELGISQPGVSHNVKVLENFYGVRLLNRYDTDICLTNAGDVVAHYAKEILNTMSDLESVVRDGGKLVQEISIGCTSYVAANLISEQLAKFAIEYPNIRVRIEICGAGELEEMLLSNNIDIALADINVQKKYLKVIPWQEHEVVVTFLSTEVTGNSKGVLKAEDLRGRSCILPKIGSGSRAAIERFLQASKMQISDLNCVMEIDESIDIRPLINSGVGVYVGVNAIPNSENFSSWTIVSLHPRVTTTTSILACKKVRNDSVLSFMKFFPKIRANNQRIRPLTHELSHSDVRTSNACTKGKWDTDVPPFSVAVGFKVRG